MGDDVREEDEDRMAWPPDDHGDNDDVKKTAKELIEKYYYQLTNGCGNPNCSNQHCASSGKIGPLTSNEAAGKALQLFASRARLCEGPAHTHTGPHTHTQGQRSEDTRIQSQTPEHADISGGNMDLGASGGPVGSPGDAHITPGPSGTSTARPGAQRNSGTPIQASGSETRAISEPRSVKSRSSAHTGGSLASAGTPGPGQTTQGPSRTHTEEREPLELSERRLNEIIAECKMVENYAKLRRYLWEIFSSEDALGSSFLGPPEGEGPSRGALERPEDSGKSSQNSGAPWKSKVNEDGLMEQSEGAGGPVNQPGGAVGPLGQSEGARGSSQHSGAPWESQMSPMETDSTDFGATTEEGCGPLGSRAPSSPMEESTGPGDKSRGPVNDSRGPMDLDEGNFEPPEGEGGPGEPFKSPEGEGGPGNTPGAPWNIPGHDLNTPGHEEAPMEEPVEVRGPGEPFQYPEGAGVLSKEELRALEVDLDKDKDATEEGGAYGAPPDTLSDISPPSVPSGDNSAPLMGNSAPLMVGGAYGAPQGFSSPPSGENIAQKSPPSENIAPSEENIAPSGENIAQKSPSGENIAQKSPSGENIAQNSPSSENIAPSGVEGTYSAPPSENIAQNITEKSESSEKIAQNSSPSENIAPSGENIAPSGENIAQKTPLSENIAQKPSPSASSGVGAPSGDTGAPYSAPTLDIEGIRGAYSALYACPLQEFESTLLYALEQLLSGVLLKLRAQGPSKWDAGPSWGASKGASVSQGPSGSSNQGPSGSSSQGPSGSSNQGPQSSGAVSGGPSTSTSSQGPSGSSNEGPQSSGALSGGPSGSSNEGPPPSGAVTGGPSTSSDSQGPPPSGAVTGGPSTSSDSQGPSGSSNQGPSGAVSGGPSTSTSSQGPQGTPQPSTVPQGPSKWEPGPAIRYPGPLTRIFIILLENPRINTTEFIEGALPQICRALSQLPDTQQGALAYHLSSWGPESLRALVQSLHQVITIRLLTTEFTREYTINDDDIIAACVRSSRVLFYASILGGELDYPLLKDLRGQPRAPEKYYGPWDKRGEASRGLFDDASRGGYFEGARAPQDTSDPFAGPFASRRPPARAPHFDALAAALGVHHLDSRAPKIPFAEFYDDFLSDELEMDRDFAYFKAGDGDSTHHSGRYGDKFDKFSFLLYPFILSPATKALGLYYDNRIRMYSERRVSVYQSVYDNNGLANGANNSGYLSLKVRRWSLITDALVELEMVASESPSDLKKQLFIEFVGEDGIDEGGVSKEFFSVIIEEIFMGNYGMFIYNESTYTYWFNHICFESDAQFTLVGIILGLAIYNNVILDVHFPPIMYKKLSNKPASFHDLNHCNTSLYKSLTELLKYSEDDLEDVFMQTFQVTVQDVFGNNLTYDLLPDGDNIPVTQANKGQFCDLYADLLLNKLVDRQFTAFKKGFDMVTDDSPLRQLFRPEEVELLISGSGNYDFMELMKSTEYDGGYNSDSEIIRQFWEIVHDMDTEDKKKLLQFTTGSARVPVGGLARLKLIIARHGPDTDRLPTAHTCFNVLLLPQYSSKEKLKDRLYKAIKYFQGFGML